jgi:hypothetical protein
MSPDSSISNLTGAHQLFLQRFIANRVMSDEEAKLLYAEVIAVANDGGVETQELNQIDERQFQRFLGTVGAALRDAFDFDLRTVSIPHRTVASNKGSRKGSTRYHAFVNKLSDTPAKLYGAPNKNPHELSFFRLILEHMIDDGNSITTGSQNEYQQLPSTGGCQGSLSDIEIINLRNELKGPHANKMNSHEVEKALQKYVQEKWLLETSGDHDESDEEESSNKRRRRGKDVKYQIGPRTYMELESVLKNIGLSEMPQFILHSS